MSTGDVPTKSCELHLARGFALVVIYPSSVCALARLWSDMQESVYEFTVPSRSVQMITLNQTHARFVGVDDIDIIIMYPGVVLLPVMHVLPKGLCMGSVLVSRGLMPMLCPHL